MPKDIFPPMPYRPAFIRAKVIPSLKALEMYAIVKK